jgi:hypothetical protein
MPDPDPQLLARARGRTPADPAVRGCWDPVVLGVAFGWLTAGELPDLVAELRRGRDVHIGQLAFSHAGAELQATIDGRGGSCPPAAMCAELDRLLAEPPDVAGLAATPIEWGAGGDPELPYRARLDGQNLLIRLADLAAEPRYRLFVDGCELAELPSWPAAWRRPPAQPGGPGGLGGGPGGVLSAARLRVWSERLCRVSPGEPAEIFAALGVAGSVRTDSWGHVTVEPPPAGTERVELDCDGGRARSLAVRLADAGLPRAELDFYFGHGQWLPRVHWDRPHKLAYQVEVDGAPSTCTVFPSFADEPAETTPADSVALRRDRP